MLSFKKTMDLFPYDCWKGRHLLLDCIFDQTLYPQILQSLCSVNSPSVLWMSINENTWNCACGFCSGISEWGVHIWWIVKIDKTWVHHYKPVSKQRSMSGNIYHAHNTEKSEMSFLWQSCVDDVLWFEWSGSQSLSGIRKELQSWEILCQVGGRNLNLLSAVNTVYCSRTKLNLIQPMQPLKWFENFTLNFSLIHCTVQNLLNFIITCLAHWRSMTWLLIKMVNKVKIWCTSGYTNNQKHLF
jgi:hypothetical protein